MRVQLCSDGEGADGQRGITQVAQPQRRVRVEQPDRAVVAEPQRAEGRGAEGALPRGSPGAQRRRGSAAPAARTSPHCARWRSAWSITTSASSASAMGVARMPTQGSWRPKVSTRVGWPARSIDARGTRIELVGLMAIDTTRSCPVEMPPSTPPAWLLRKPSGDSSSPCSLPFCVTHAEAGADLHALDGVQAHHRVGDVGVELVVQRLAQAHRHAARGDGQARAAGVAGLAQRVHVGLELRR